MKGSKAQAINRCTLNRNRFIFIIIPLD
jgi:hypothetical protein